MSFNLKRRAMELARRRAAAVVGVAVAEIRTEIVELMRSSEPSGYEDPETGYVSSAPGEPPAYGRGVYAESWKESPVVEQGLEISAAAYTDLVDPRTDRNVGISLEYGDEDNEPRPHARPGLAIARERIHQMIREMSRGRAP